MAHFDITEATVTGYQRLWAERRYLVRLAAVPFLIKTVCLMTVLALGWETDFLRQAIILLPSFFADGWLLAHVVRLVFLDQRWPFRPSGKEEEDMRNMQDRASGIMRGMVMFAVIKFLLAGFTAGLFAFSQAGIDPAQQEVSIGTAVIAVMILLAAVWGFRLFWLYIPAAVHWPLHNYMRALGGFTASWPLIGTWLLCYVPLFLATGFVASLISALLQAGGHEAAVIFVAALLRVVLDTVVAILTTISIAAGLRHMVEAHSA